MMLKFTPDGKINRNWIASAPGSATMELADALDECVAALRFYANSEWNDDYPGGITYEKANRRGRISTYLDSGEKALSALRKIEAEP